MGVGKKLMLYFILIIIIIFSLVFVYTYKTTHKAVEQKFGFMLDEMVDQLTDHMNSKIQEIERSTNMLIMNTEFVEHYMHSDDTTPPEKLAMLNRAKDLVNIMIYSSNDIKSIIIKLINTNETFLYGEHFSDPYYIDPEIRETYDYFLDHNDDFFDKPLVESIMAGHSRFQWLTGIDGNYEQIYLMKKVIHFDTGKVIGLITVILDIDTFTSLYEDIQQEFNSTNILLDTNRKIAAHDQKDLMGTELPDTYNEIILQNNDPSNYSINNNNELMAYEQARNGWMYIASVPMNYLLREIIQSWIRAIFIVIICIIGASLIFFSYTKKISGNMKILVNKMLKVEEGIMDVDETIQTEDELGTIDLHFNRMVEKLNTLIRKNYVKELENKEAKLNALQLQINPHFLYNTLESINAMGSVYRSPEICTISQKLGEMLRYSINVDKSELVPLEKEINHIENYLSIQNIRFDDLYQVKYNIDTSIRKSKVIKLILQPVVENILLHAFSDEHEGIIQIEAKKDHGHLKIIITDNGIGMSQNEVDQLNHYISKDIQNTLSGYKKSVGMRNVNLRIKLFFGESYGLTVTSEKNKGTQVTYRLPLINDSHN